MLDPNDVLKKIEKSADKLADCLVIQWKAEEDLVYAGHSQKEGLRQMSDKSKDSYNTTYKYIKGLLAEECRLEGKGLDAIMKRISGNAYNVASEEYQNIQKSG